MASIIPPQPPKTERNRTLGLVLAGGRSRRMGTDKGQIALGDGPQVVHALGLLAELCSEVFVSVNAEQAAAAYRGLPVIVDNEPDRGPAQGLLTAWQQRPGVAWLVLAVDLLFVDRRLLRYLQTHRKTTAVATAFYQGERIPEPLCAFWEPDAQPWVRRETEAGAGSLRRVLETAPAHLLDCPDPHRLASVNTPQQLDRLLGVTPASLAKGGHFE